MVGRKERNFFLRSGFQCIVTCFIHWNLLSLSFLGCHAKHADMVLVMPEDNHETSHIDYFTGGEPFDIQPAVQIYEAETASDGHKVLSHGELITDFVGYVSAELYFDEKYRHVVLRKQHEEGNASGKISVPVQNGTAVFSGLYVNEATINEGDNNNRYRLLFTLEDQHHRKVAFLIGEQFIVEVGEPYQLGIVVQPSSASGGQMFLQQPVVAIQDRGGNTVLSYSKGMVCSFVLLKALYKALKCIYFSIFSSTMISSTRSKRVCVSQIAQSICSI